ncbi:hypothetical protein MD484_g8851, partial [Candolleomyces efflorescens]
MAPRWADDSQWECLTNYIGEYNRCCEAGTKKEFCYEFAVTFKEKFQLGPLPAQIESLGEEKAKKAYWDLLQTRITNWFANNSTRATSTVASGSKRGTIEPPKKRKLQHWQVYQNLYWDKGLEGRVNAECFKVHKVPLGSLDAQKRFSVRNELITKFYREETDKVRRHVNEVRDEDPAKTVSTDEIVKNLGKLPRTLKQYGETIKAKTEWSGILVFGGPHPSHDDRVFTYIRCVGTTPDGRSFDEFLGQEAYTEWLGHLDSFFQACADRPPALNNEAPKNSAPDTKSGVPISAASASSSVLPKSDKPQNSNDGRPQKSEYERTRDINIAKNKVIMSIVDHSVEKGTEASRLVEELKEVGVEMDAEELQATLAKIRSFCSLPSSTPTTMTTTTTTPHHDSATAEVPATPDLGGESKSPAADARPANDAAIQVLEIDDSLKTVDTVATDTSNLDGSLKTAHTVDIDAPILEIPRAAHAIDDGAGILVKPLTEINSEAATTQAQEATGNTDPAGSIPSGDIANTTGDTGRLGTGGLATKASGEAPGSTSGGDEPGKDGQPVHPSIPPIKELEIALPAYLKGTWKYLRSVSDADTWCTLLNLFLLFETQNASSKKKGGRMNTLGRPAQVQEWIRAHHKTAVPALDLAAYVPQFGAWWKTIQPAWRTGGVDGLDPASFSHEIPAEANWSSLARGGSAGFYTVVMALSWWVGKVSGDVWSAELTAIVNDAIWVLRQVVAQESEQPVVSASTGKRPLDSEDGTKRTSSGREVKR